MTTTQDVALYGHWICPYSTRVEFALHQRQIDHGVVDVPPLAVRGTDFELPAAFIAHSPRLEIPMVRVEDDYLADSIPILEWLERRLPDHPLLPADPDEAARVRDRVAWVDRHVFRPMIGIYYGTDPDRIRAAGDLLVDALDDMASWLAVHEWLGGAEPSLVEAVIVPFYVRLDGLRRLGFDQQMPIPVEDHARNCTDLVGWPAVAWSAAQTDEFVGRFEAHRRLRARERT